MVARAVHDHSSRRNGPFVAVNCSALPPHLIQSELFGHEKGSFTGAYQRHLGSIESAQGGTIFLDEIGDLPLELQGNLLRFLQEKTIVRVGATRPVEVDVRVIAATHVDLEAAVAGGGLREDLYYRLNALELCVPALRERGEDIELLAKSRFRQFRRPADHKVRGFSTSAIDAMMAHRWKGNVRELINRVEKAIVMSENRLITPTDLGLTVRTLSRGEPSLRTARAMTDAGLIKEGLMRNHGNVAKTARELEVSRVTLYRLIEKFGIEHR
jgi:DNA-binding NtrC family response regulator